VTNKLFAGLAALASLGASPALAAQPVDWQLGFQPAATEIMAQIRGFETYTLWFIVPITLFVLALLVYAMVKFRAGANPTPSKTSHNSLIEVIWTLGPVVILLAIAIPSFNLLTAQYSPPGSRLHHQGHRLPVVLGLRVSDRRRSFLRLADAAGKRPRRLRQGRRRCLSPPAGCRQRVRGSRRQDRAPAGDRR
jgi:hypothetical protein